MALHSGGLRSRNGSQIERLYPLRRWAIQYLIRGAKQVFACNSAEQQLASQHGKPPLCGFPEDVGDAAEFHLRFAKYSCLPEHCFLTILPFICNPHAHIRGARLRLQLAVWFILLTSTTACTQRAGCNRARRRKRTAGQPERVRRRGGDGSECSAGRAKRTRIRLGALRAPANRSVS